MNSRLEVRDVTTKHHSFVLSSISFTLKSGDILGLIGRSGAGKSTLIKTILGLKDPSAGSIALYSGTKKIPLSIGYSPQENSLFPFLTVEENLQIFGKLNGVSTSDISQRTDYLLKQVGLLDSRKKRVAQLSGGMKKRADLAVSLIHDPLLVILDEPFNGLDITIQKFIWKLVHELSDAGKMIVVSSHIIHDVEKHCSEFGLVHDGSFFGTTQLRSRLKKHSLEEYLGVLFDS